jgi:hypothetical protein
MSACPAGCCVRGHLRNAAFALKHGGAGMTDDLLRECQEVLVRANCRIDELERAVLDLAEYVSRADLNYYVDPETRKVLNEIGEGKDDN